MFGMIDLNTITNSASNKLFKKSSQHYLLLLYYILIKKIVEFMCNGVFIL